MRGLSLRQVVSHLLDLHTRIDSPTLAKSWISNKTTGLRSRPWNTQDPALRCVPTTIDTYSSSTVLLNPRTHLSTTRLSTSILETLMLIRLSLRNGQASPLRAKNSLSLSHVEAPSFLQPMRSWYSAAITRCVSTSTRRSSRSSRTTKTCLKDGPRDSWLRLRWISPSTKASNWWAPVASATSLISPSDNSETTSMLLMAPKVTCTFTVPRINNGISAS